MMCGLALGCVTTGSNSGPVDAPKRSGMGLPEARALFEKGDVTGAITSAEMHIEQKPKDWRGHYTLGTLLLITGDHAGALDAMEEAILQAPDEGVVHNNLGLVCMRLGKLDRAVVALRHASHLMPRDADPLVNLGAAYTRKGAFHYGIQAYEDALALAPEHVLGRLGYANALAKAGSRAQALAEYRDLEKSASMKTHTLEIHVGMSTVLRQMGRFTDSLGHADKAVELGPKNALALLAAAMVRDYKGDHDGASGFYDRARLAAPDHLDVLYNYGVFLAERKRKTDAEEMFERYLELNPGNPFQRNDVKQRLEQLRSPKK